MLPYRSTKALRIEDYRVRLADRPGWVRGTMREPQQGEAIYCAAGLGIVTALGGKTGDGSRLVQIGLPDAAKRPYFAAASNVLLPPLETPMPVDWPGGDTESSGPAQADMWFGGPEPTRL